MREQQLADDLYVGTLQDGVSPTIDDFAEWLYQNYGWTIQQAREFGFAIAKKQLSE